VNQPIYDLVSIGETMLRFSPKSPLRLEQSSELETHVGGSESNTLVGLSRLGLKSAWISRLPSHVLGQSIARNIAMHGVDTQHVVWSESDRSRLTYCQLNRCNRPDGFMRRGSLWLWGPGRTR